MDRDWDNIMDDAEDEYNNEEQQAASVQDILARLLSSNSGISGNRTINISGITLRDLSQLLGTTNTLDDDDEDDELWEEDEDEDDEYAVRPDAHKWFEQPTEPQDAGVELLNGGDFGKVAPKAQTRRNDVNLAKYLANRAYKPQPSTSKEEYVHVRPFSKYDIYCTEEEQNLVPNTNGTAVAACDANIYTGQFSADSSFYYTCSQDFRLHVFDTRAAPVSRRPGSYRGHTDHSLQTTMQIKKTIQGQAGRWTITDANLSPDNERMIYSSITPTVYMTSTLDDSPKQIPIYFGDSSRSYADAWGYGERFGIWSCRFSADGNEVVAGGMGNIFVYDLLANKRTVRITAHSDDVNSCTWADTASGNVLISASDDTFLKVWDRRSLGASRKPSGVLIGHTEGITYVSAKGDGRYVISNGKDQALRLWDLRQMRSSADFDAVERKNYGVPHFDYRYPHYPKPRYKAHPKDCSVMTYRGHAVLRTLIRCHFSPMETTGAQYIYSGSADGRIHVWSLDGRVVQVLDRAKTLPMSFDPSAPELASTRGLRSSTCVRDVSWHSQEPVMLSAAWESGRAGSVVARHEWKGLLKMGGKLDDWAEKHNLEQSERSTRQHNMVLRNHGRHIPGAYLEDDFEDEDSDEDM